jgi:hypothetical protein
MIAIERMIQKVAPGKWAALEVVDKKFDAMESRFGFPAKKRYQCLLGSHDSNTLIIERQWASLAALEAAYDKIFADPAYKALLAELVGIVESSQSEVYGPLP